ncbi:MAG: replicative DNA helicase [Nitrospirae bacterium GWC2_42_7]|nr:MAG: replicative DNA helicase [Nitrospirae bacterium GWC2_42_7]
MTEYIAGVPPQNIEAEQFVLGALLIDNGAMTTALKLISYEDFYRKSHGKIFIAMNELFNKNEPIDIITMTDYLRRMNDLEEVGGSQYLTSLVTMVPTSANIKYHSMIIQEHAKKRKLMDVCRKVIDRINEDNLDALMMQLRSETQNILSRGAEPIVDMREVARKTLECIERRYIDKGKISGIPSGYADIDTITDGFQPCDLIILGARPSMGKTALAMAMVQNAAETGCPVGVVSIEMGSQQIGIRTMASLSQVEIWKLRKGILKREEFNAITSATSRMVSLPIYFSFSAMELDQIRKVITQMVEVKGVKMIVVDYLQLARNQRQKVREREIGEISTTLKQLAKTFQIPVIALSQLSREVEKREDKRPKLSDLRDSGGIEQDADIVMFLYRDNPKEVQGITEVHFAKGRNIGLGNVKLYFDGNTMSFRNHKDK